MAGDGPRRIGMTINVFAARLGKATSVATALAIRAELVRVGFAPRLADERIEDLLA